MKTLFLFTILFLFCNNFGLFAQNVSVPDSSFKAYLVGNIAINTNGDTEIQVSEASAFTGTINCSSLGIVDLIGIENFTALTSLDCRNNLLGTLGVSSNTALTYLNCANNSLSTLDVSSNTALIDLYCNGNLLSTLNLSNNTALTKLHCSNNSFSTLDVSSNTALIDLYCYTNQLTVLDFTQNTALEVLECTDNQLAALDFTQNTALAYLYCNINQLTLLDVSSNIALIDLYCNTNQLTSLNVANGNNTNIAAFQATGNPNLNCIQVDDTIYSNTNWTSIDVGTVFRTSAADCSVLNGVTTVVGQLPNLNAYPNPTTGTMSLYLGKSYNSSKVEISNIMGQVVFSNNYSGEQSLDLEFKL